MPVAVLAALPGVVYPVACAVVAAFVGVAVAITRGLAAAEQAMGEAEADLHEGWGTDAR